MHGVCHAAKRVKTPLEIKAYDSGLMQSAAPAAAGVAKQAAVCALFVQSSSRDGAMLFPAACRWATGGAAAQHSGQIAKLGFDWLSVFI
jgi:hypothetical protein